mgnify:CR=1 FL=1
MPTNKKTRSKVAKATAKENAWNRKLIKDSEGFHMTVACAKLMFKRTIKAQHTRYIGILETLREMKRKKEAEDPTVSVNIDEKRWLVGIAAYGHLYNDNLEKATYKRAKFVEYNSEKLDVLMENDGVKKYSFTSLNEHPSTSATENAYDGPVNTQAILIYADSAKNGLANMDDVFKNYRFLYKC